MHVYYNMVLKPDPCNQATAALKEKGGDLTKAEAEVRILTLKSDTWNPKPETRNSRPET